MNFYVANAERLFQAYRSVPFEQVHGAWLHLIPSHAALMLDVGAGSGRDAEWFSCKGHEVVAVEPCAALRRLAVERTPAAVRWIDDSLPALSRVHELGLKFDLVLVSAVWMHVAPGDRPRALRKLAGLLRPGGLLVFSIRETPFQDDRVFHETNPAELRDQAKHLMLEPVLESPASDHLGRPEVTWRMLMFRMPDDGTGALHDVQASDRNVTPTSSHPPSHPFVLLPLLSRLLSVQSGSGVIGSL